MNKQTKNNLYLKELNKFWNEKTNLNAYFLRKIWKYPKREKEINKEHKIEIEKLELKYLKKKVGLTKQDFQNNL